MVKHDFQAMRFGADAVLQICIDAETRWTADTMSSGCATPEIQEYGNTLIR